MEKSIGESLEQRTSILGNISDLGPPDMVHLAKRVSNSSTKEPTAGTFFYYTGTDVSNSATIAALLHSIADIIDEKPQLWFGKHKFWKVCEATYCTYDAFSGVDARVKVNFPGGVELSVLDSGGKEVSSTDKVWQEIYVCGMVRALITADNDSSDFSSVVEIRKVNPMLTKERTKMFFEGFEKLFFEGTKLGCSEDLQVATNGNNNLVDAFLTCVRLTGEFKEAIAIIQRLRNIDPSINFLEAKIDLLADEEVQAVKIMHNIVDANPLDGEALTLQAEFCIEKNRLDLALPLATKAMNSAPWYFKPWSLLVEVYIKTGEYEKALLTLNSCPMVTHKDKYILKRINNPKPEDMHLPLPVDVTLDQVSTLNSVDVAIEHNRVDPTLMSLPATSLKSTFMEAYDLLTEIVHKTGWEKLLKYRTHVFVMEGEFKGGKEEEKMGDQDAVENIKKIDKLNSSTETYKSKALPETPESPSSETSDYKNKQLCERWLDNLFMLLYDDLRVYTMYKAEKMHFDAEKVEMKKTTLEWELTGLVAQRLGHKEEAASCFRKGLGNRFSPRCSSQLLKYYLELHSSVEHAKVSKPVSDLHDKILELTVNLLVWNHRWYCSFSPELILSLKDLVNEVGRVKIESEVKVQFDDKNTGIYDLVLDNLRFLDTYGLIEKEE